LLSRHKVGRKKIDLKNFLAKQSEKARQQFESNMILRNEESEHKKYDPTLGDVEKKLERGPKQKKK